VPRSPRSKSFETELRADPRTLGSLNSYRSRMQRTLSSQSKSLSSVHPSRTTRKQIADVPATRPFRCQRSMPTLILRRSRSTIQPLRTGQKRHEPLMWHLLADMTARAISASQGAGRESSCSGCWIGIPGQARSSGGRPRKSRECSTSRARR